MRLVGYARVSTLAQDTALQLDALRLAGVQTIFQDSGSGVGPRPQLQMAISSLAPGDLLVVWKLDRCARSLSDLLSILSRVKKAGASIKSLTEPIDTSNPIGEFTFQILGAVAQLERSMIRERVVAGQAAAKARGKTWGTRSHITEEQRQALLADFVQGGKTVRECGDKLGIAYCVARRAISKEFPIQMFSPQGRPGRPKKCA